MKTIALVDDSDDNTMLCKLMLEDLFQIASFSSAKDALEAFSQNAPDLVLLDISMPVMDGIEMLKRMRQNETLKPIPVIALTAHAMKGDAEKYMKYGFDGYVTKPIVDEKVLIDTINNLLGGQNK